ncbi:Uncharacterised protein [BD1-7 clade bacterium]|uniref:Polyhydroxyalkanoic acid system protein n=1 Tax=BD1-7 clade bacterium TaxID=2029982 RepID=A0A5S9QN59_9GAMM|nr:Uncharacterised protein [BD1-7 clade bacterium]
MAKVKVTKPFTMPFDDVLEGIERIANDLNKEHGMSYSWVSQQKVEFSHKAGKGFLAIEGSNVVLEMKISMLYAAMAPIVKKRVEQFAQEYIH